MELLKLDCKVFGMLLDVYNCDTCFGYSIIISIFAKK